MSSYDIFEQQRVEQERQRKEQAAEDLYFNMTVFALVIITIAIMICWQI